MPPTLGPFAEPVALRAVAERLASIRPGVLPSPQILDEEVRAALAAIAKNLGQVRGDDEIPERARLLPANVQRVLISVIPHISDGEMARRAVLASWAIQPRQLVAKAPWLMGLLYRKPAGGVLARAYNLTAPADAPRFWRALANARLKSNPIAVVREVLEDRAGSWIDACSWHGLPQKQRDGVYGAVGIGLLHHGTHALFLAQDESAMIEAFEMLTPEEWPAAVEKYFSALEIVEYPSGTLNALQKEMGAPLESDDPRWTTISPATRERIHRAIIERALTAFFDAAKDNERFQFWRRWANQMRAVRPRLGNAAVIMAFPRFFVIEFRDTGNAAYFYDASLIDEFSARNVTSAYQLKDRRRALLVLNHVRGWPPGFAQHLSRRLA